MDRTVDRGVNLATRLSNFTDQQVIITNSEIDVGRQAITGIETKLRSQYQRVIDPRLIVGVAYQQTLIFGRDRTS